LIDLSYDAIGDYKYICYVHDHFTRFSWAKSLISKRAVEVAAFLFDLFFFIGSPPTILQSDNGKKFCAEIIKKLVNLWPSVKIINRRPRHLQSQGLVEGKMVFYNKNWESGGKPLEGAISIHETEIKSPKSKYFSLEAQSRN
jgi:hypothetical protein